MISLSLVSKSSSTSLIFFSLVGDTLLSAACVSHKVSSKVVLVTVIGLSAAQVLTVDFQWLVVGRALRM